MNTFIHVSFYYYFTYNCIPSLYSHTRKLQLVSTVRSGRPEVFLLFLQKTSRRLLVNYEKIIKLKLPKEPFKNLFEEIDIKNKNYFDKWNCDIKGHNPSELIRVHRSSYAIMLGLEKLKTLKVKWKSSNHKLFSNKI